ncbi:hypothetical protein LCGC14_1486330 [marine sediment metagenome]|uniref:Tip attachment protein J domain-containing protein n=1 Tax=marine sediment metagenome TaxID=412755 RepID=A0A0F9JTX8_9ZZZZ
MPRVRNIGGIGAGPIPVYVWIPPTFSPIHKVEILSGTTTTDITDIMIRGEFIDGVTETIGSFSFQIDNSAETYTNLFNTYDQVKLYYDYGTTASTQRFTGLIERVSKKEHTLILSGRGTAAKFSGKNVTYAATNTARSTILSEIIAKYFSSELTTNNLETDSGTATVSYSDKPWQEVVEELCQASGFDAYVDKDSDFNYFEAGSRLNITEAAVHEFNLISVGDFSPDASNIFNKVKVYGKEIGGFPILATASDTSSQSTYGVKELRIDDSNIITFDQAQVRADYELSLLKDPPTVGEVTSLSLPTILPGERIRISDPQNGLNPQYYPIQKFMHTFSNDAPPMTTLTIKKERNTIPNILKKRIKFESDITVSNNPNELDYSYIEDFETSSGTLTKVLFRNGTLISDGTGTGTWNSGAIILQVIPTTFSLSILDTADSKSIIVKISFDGGITFKPLITNGIGQDITFSTNTKSIIIEITLISSIAEVSTLGILYK